MKIFNKQRKIRIDVSIFEDFTSKAIETFTESRGKSLATAFVSDRKMRELNKTFRGKNSTTDVLSFPFAPDEFEENDDFLGDIVISLAQAQKQAAANNLPLEIEIKQLILHGILHLCGYDHETDNGEMNRLELELRQKLAIDF